MNFKKFSFLWEVLLIAVMLLLASPMASTYQPRFTYEKRILNDDPRNGHYRIPSGQR
ncbi:hypothetical protein TorRG33x02_090040 [Trema orientale]|uniref:Transmembrane protein n=1 Tax=Trema orientale TaxID=63057 RepID=A0A2P5FBE1_TREOI|nr:hypothetical protein TorRG33x02_090040 [Trema orientale]